LKNEESFYFKYKEILNGINEIKIFIETSSAFRLPIIDIGLLNTHHSEFEFEIGNVCFI
jgi:hypothetical protein